jgi:hypothetical protein
MQQEPLLTWQSHSACHAVPRMIGAAIQELALAAWRGQGAIWAIAGNGVAT